MILSRHFFDLLDNLTGQFFATRSAQCVGREFGVNVSQNAKEYFSVAIISENLPNDLVMLGVLLDDSVHIASRNGFTFVIYIDPSKINENAFEVISLIIISHEICHFAFYYELFIKLGDNTGIVAHSNYTHTISGTFMEGVTQEQDKTSQTIFDEHNINELLRNLRNYPKRHFAKGKETKIDYRDFLDDFLVHLRFDEILEEYQTRIM